jgi:hypothetical protein
MGLGFIVGMLVKTLGLFGSWDDLWVWGSLSCYMREITYVNYLLLPI